MFSAKLEIHAVNQWTLFFFFSAAVSRYGTQRSVPPHLCFNLGSMGFLSPFEYETMKEEVRRIMSGGMKVSLRMRLSARIIRDDQTSEAFHALNEIVIDRGEKSV